MDVKCASFRYVSLELIILAKRKHPLQYTVTVAPHYTVPQHLPQYTTALALASQNKQS